MYDWIVVALRLSPIQLNSTQLSGSGAGLLEKSQYDLRNILYVTYVNNKSSILRTFMGFFLIMNSISRQY